MSSGQHRLPASDRLKRRTDFRRVQSEGQRVHTASFVILVHPAPGGHGRLGITVTKKVGGAVQRNRIKRLVREIFRQNRELFPPSCDVVLIAKRNLDAVELSALHEEARRARHAMTRACERAHRPTITVTD